MRAERGTRAARLPWLLCAAAILATPGVRATGTPDTTFAAADAAVYAGVSRNGILHIGGAFTTINGSSFPHLAAIVLDQKVPVSAWAPQLNDTVRALALAPDGRTLYVGGDFTAITTPLDGALARNRLAALNVFALNSASENVVLPWNPAADGAVRTMVLSADGRTLYVGGDFTAIADATGNVARRHLAAISVASGAVLPWNPDADGSVRTLVLSADGTTLYAGGDFTIIGGQARRGVAALQTVNGKATTWDAALTGTVVYSLLRSGTTLYAGGSFNAIGGQARANLAALDVASAAATAWNPATDGAVHALALSGDGTRLYAGGTFTTAAGGTARSRIAGFRTDVTSADVIAWDPGGDSAITSIDFLLASAAGDVLYAGGDFTRIGGADRAGLAAFAIGPPRTAASPTGGGFQSLPQVTLTCTDVAGAGCAQLYYTTDGSTPSTPVAYTAPVPLTLGGDTTLKYFAVDADGNREAVHTEVYALDTTAPVTANSLPPGLYGSATVQDVELACGDANAALGCTTYYTLDNTEPGLTSAAYAGPISLADLFPPAGIEPDDVDPLRDLAGTVTLKYFSVDDAGNREATQTAIYQVDLSGPRATVSHATGNYVGPIAVTLSCNDGTGSGCAAMYYTIDDSTPSDGTVTDEAGNVIPRTTLYTGAITIDTATILRVLALDGAGNQTSGIIGIYSFSSEVGDRRSSVGGVDVPVLLALALLALGRARAARVRS